MRTTVILSALLVGCGHLAETEPLPLDWPDQPSITTIPEAGELRFAPPPQPLTIQFDTAFIAGQRTWLTVSGAAPGETVHLGRSTTGLGSGPCPAALGGLCVDIQAPVSVHASVAANGQGVASFPIDVPVAAAGGWAGFQAAIPRGVGGVDSLESPVVAGYVGPEDNDTGLPQFYQGPTLIHQVAPSCNALGTQWNYDVQTVGWTSAAIVNASDTQNAPNQWDEEHDLLSVDFDPLGEWDRLQLSLTDAVSVAIYTPNSNTVFRCNVHLTDGTMTFAYRIYDINGNLADCVAFGHDPAGLTSGAYALINGFSNPAELAACTFW